MEILLIIIVSISVILIIVEFLTCLIYGFFIKEKDLKKYLDKNEGNFKLNSLNHTIIMNEKSFIDLNFITTLPFTTFSAYYVNHMGRVWRWSDSHKRISKIHKELIEQEKQNLYDGK